MKLTQVIITTLLTLTTGLIGWQCWWFVIIYQSGNTGLIRTGLDQFMHLLPYIAIAGILLSLLLGGLVALSDNSKIIFTLKRLWLVILMQKLYFLLLILDTYLYYSDLHLNIFELLNTSLGAGIVYLTGLLYYRSGAQMYQHPTSMGGTFVQAILLGISFYILFLSDETDVRFAATWFMILIVLDLFILIGRFRHLSGFSELTNRVARKLMGEYIFLFGARIILGIFIPLVLVIYALIRGNYEFKGVSALIILGGLLHSGVLSMAGTEISQTVQGDHEISN